MPTVDADSRQGVMSYVATTLFILVGLTNLFPAVGVLGAVRLEGLYGVALAGDDLLLLMRHRAVLLGLVGAFILLAAFRVKWRTAASIAGLVSMLSFVLIAIPPQTHGAALQRVFWIDVIACVLLLGGYLISRRQQLP
jgi:hypothetical protein